MSDHYHPWTDRQGQSAFGDHWPPTDLRLDMLEEAIEVMRELWRGEAVNHEGVHYTVPSAPRRWPWPENSRIYSLPDEPPPVYISATTNLTEDQVAETIVCGPDPERHVEMVTKFFEAGYDEVYVSQVGADQSGFLDFYKREVLPKFT